MKKLYSLLVALLFSFSSLTAQVMTQTFSSLPSTWVQSNSCNSASTNASWKLTTSNPGYGASGYTDNTGGSGSYAMWVDGSSPYPCDVSITTDSIDVSTLTNPSLEFYWFKNNTSANVGNNTLTVEVFDGQTYHPVWSGSTDFAGWRRVQVDFSCISTPNDIVLRFTVSKFNGSVSFYNDVIVDDIKVQELPAGFSNCAAPTGIAVGTVSGGSATATVSLGCNSSATTTVIYGLAGFNPSSTGTSATVSSGTAALTSLASSSTYDIYAVTTCGTSTYSDTLGPISFSTPCAAVATPWSENFDNSATGSAFNPSVPVCWDLYANTTSSSYYPYFYNRNYSFYANSGSNFLYGHRSSSSSTSTTYADTTMIITPEIQGLDSATKQLEFYARTTSVGRPGEVIIGLTDAAGTPSSFNAVDTVYATATAYNKYTIYLDGATTGDARIAFMLRREIGVYDYICIDDVSVTDIPPCPEPIGLSLTNSTQSSATISWSSSSSAFNIEVGPMGFTQGTGTSATSTTNSYTATGLTQNTYYDAYVMANCTSTGDGTSNWVGPFTFKTECGAFASPYSEDFGYSDGTGSTANPDLPDCWEHQNLPAYTLNYCYVDKYYFYGNQATDSAYAYLRTYYSQFSAQTALGDTNMMILPRIAGLENGTQQILFNARSISTSAAYLSDIAIATIDSNKSLASLSIVDTIQVTSTTYSDYSLDLDNVASDAAHVVLIAFGGSNTGYTYGYNGAYFDKITIKSSCPSISNVKASSLGFGKYATITWDADSTNSSFIVEWGPDGFVPGSGAMDTVFLSSFNQGTGVNNLTKISWSNTFTGSRKYNVYIKAFCPSRGNFSDVTGPILVHKNASLTNDKYRLKHHFVGYQEDSILITPKDTNLVSVVSWDTNPGMSSFWAKTSGEHLLLFTDSYGDSIISKYVVHLIENVFPDTIYSCYGEQQDFSLRLKTIVDSNYINYTGGVGKRIRVLDDSKIFKSTRWSSGGTVGVNISVSKDFGITWKSFGSLSNCIIRGVYEYDDNYVVTGWKYGSGIQGFLATFTYNSVSASIITTTTSSGFDPWPYDVIYHNNKYFYSYNTGPQYRYFNGINHFNIATSNSPLSDGYHLLNSELYCVESNGISKINSSGIVKSTLPNAESVVAWSKDSAVTYLLGTKNLYEYSASGLVQSRENTNGMNGLTYCGNGENYGWKHGQRFGFGPLGAIAMDTIFATGNVKSVGNRYFSIGDYYIYYYDDLSQYHYPEWSFDGNTFNGHAFNFKPTSSGFASFRINIGDTIIRDSVYVNTWSEIDTSVTVSAFNPLPFIQATGAFKGIEICENDSLSLSAATGYTYQWSTGDSSQYIHVDNSGNYYLTLTDSHGCIDTSSIKQVLIHDVPDNTLTYSVDTLLCQGESIAISGASGNYSYLWITGDTIQSITVSSTDTVQLQLTSERGCSILTKSLPIQVFNRPTAIIGYAQDSVVCYGDTVSLVPAIGNNYSYLWNNNSTDSILHNTGVGTYSRRYIVTDGNGCKDTSEYKTVIVNSLPNTNVSGVGNSAVCDGDTIEFMGPSGATNYLWSTGDTTQNAFFTQTDTAFVIVTNAAGCVDTSGNVYATVYPYPVSSITVVGDSAVCDGESVVLKGPSGNSNYEWSNGTYLDSAVISASDSVYLVVTNSHGCKDTSAYKVVTVHDLPTITIDIGGVSKVCFGDSIRLVQSTSVLVDSIAWFRNTSATPYAHLDSSYAKQTGNYYAVAISDKGCVDTSNIKNVSIPQLLATTTPVNANCASSSDGVVGLSISGGYAPYNVLWNTSATTQNLVGVTPGFYVASITDSLGCFQTANAVVGFNNLPQTPVVVGASSSLCFGDMDTLYVTSPYTSILWGGQASGTADTVVVGPGVTYVATLDTNNCPAADTISIGSDAPYTTSPQVCLVTVDTATQSNLIIWERSSKDGVELYNVYREGLIGYSKIGSKGVNQLSEYVDANSTPGSQSYTYYITLEDSCGIEHGTNAGEHTTVHLQANLGTSNEVNLSWSGYQGATVLYYLIYRKDPGAANYTAIDSVNTSTTTYTDFGTATGITKYFLSAVMSSTCTSSNKTASRSLSNLVEEQTIDVPELIALQIELYPNPSQGQVLISNFNGNSCQIVDALGKSQLLPIIEGGLDVSHLPSGVYFLRFLTESQVVITKKLVISH